uniref:histidine kinase n=1 Tax=Candidatus Kentrum sp. SD TaxID=2126332 RepID=A0A450YQV9_9GAMM|nr:MAG: Signal transduction histidine kinase [Candidatus Kentron sp. SD]VFK43913.1 MAG: Signal transduction histidine kinase [Candidatus Kentron sp. SD]
MESQKLLVIDDNAAFREAITGAGEDAGWVVYAHENLNEIKAWLSEHSPDVVLFDWQLLGQRRQDYAKLLQKHGLTGNTLLLSGAMDDARERFVEEYGLAGARLKPFDLGRFEEEIELLSRSKMPDLREMLDKVSPAVDILDKNLNILWSNNSAKDKKLTREQRLIVKWLQVEIEKDSERNAVRRIDWDGEKERFLESRLYSIDKGGYWLTRDWRNEGERPHDHEFFNLEEKNPKLDHWLRAVARLLAQRYAISRFRVYKIAPLPNTEGLEQKHPPLVVPKFQSGGGIESSTKAWLRGGFEPRCVPHAEEALQSNDEPTPIWIKDSEDSSICENLARVRYGEKGTSRVSFPVHTLDDGRIVALLALDRRLDHIKGLQGFDREVVELAARMASDEAGVLSSEQWSLMRGLVEDIGGRIGIWLQDDEKQRTADWHDSISKMLLDTFAANGRSPEMTYEGISQVCQLLAKTWNEEEISGMIRGSTPWSQQAQKSLLISDWYLALISDDAWQVVAGWGDAYEICRQHNGQMVNIPRDIVTTSKAWQAIVIQEFQTWSKDVFAPSCIGDERYKAIGSWLAVPMQVEGKVRAWMVVHSPHAHYFTAFHIKLLEHAAQRLLPLLAAAQRETRARSAFTAAVMHEVKNDSHTALMVLDLVQQEMDREVAGEVKEYLTEIRHHLEGLNTLGQDTLDIFRTGGNRRAQEWGDAERDITATLGNLLENSTLGWRGLYEDTEFQSDLPKELATCKVRIPCILDFKRVLRVLLHNAFRHGEDWVHMVIELQRDAHGDGKLKLTIRNGASDDVISDLRQTFGSAMDNPGASPLTRGRLGLAVAKQLTLEVGGSLSELQYTKQDEDRGQTTICLHWPIEVVA